MSCSHLKWFDMGPCPISFGMCLTEQGYNKAMKHLAVEAPGPWLVPGSLATTYTLTNKKNYSTCVLVCLGPCKGVSHFSVMAIMVHAAVHVWQAIVEALTDDHPSKEHEAYTIENLSKMIWSHYAEHRGPRRASR